MRLGTGLTVPLFGLATLATLLASTRDAHATAIVSPEGRYARTNSEVMVVSWEPSTKREQIELASVLEGDATSLLWIVPTPTQAVVESVPTKNIEAVTGLTKMAGLPALPAPGTLPRSALTMASLESRKFETTDALVAWLGQHGLEARGALRDWAENHVERGAVFNLVRLSAGGDADGKRRELGIAGVRISFRAETPFLPYQEPEPDFEGHTAYLQRTGVCDPGAACTAPWERSLHAIVIAPEPVRLLGNDNDAPVLPMLVDAVQVPRDALPNASALRSAALDRWTLTHFESKATTRTVERDPTIALISGAPWGSPEADAPRAKHRPTVSATSAVPRRTKSTRVLFVALRLLALAATLLALRESER